MQNITYNHTITIIHYTEKQNRQIHIYMQYNIYDIIIYISQKT